jgi:hypothetical protein
LHLDTLDLNGASRQIGLMLVVLVVSWVASMRIAEGRTKRYTHLYQIYPIVFLSGLMMLVAYGVRTPCRPDYYIGCGVNMGTYLGFGLAGALLIFGLVMALAWKIPVGWLVAGIAVYYGEYMQQFYHVLTPWPRLGIIFVAACAAVPWVASVFRCVRAACRP